MRTERTAEERLARQRSIHAYEETEAWRTRASAFTAAFGGTCAACGTSGPTDAHHVEYDLTAPGKEPDEWLRALCRTCHDAVHEAAGSSGHSLRAVTDGYILMRRVLYPAVTA